MKGQGRNNTVIIALITGSFALAGVALQNWDKLVGATPAPPVNAAPAKQDPAPAASNAAAQNPSAAEPAATPVDLAAPEAATQAASEPFPNIAGTWIDGDRTPTYFVQQGPEFEFRQYVNGEQTFFARGRLQGRSINYEFQVSYGGATNAGRCRGMLRTGTFIEGTCAPVVGPAYAFVLRR